MVKLPAGPPGPLVAILGGAVLLFIAAALSAHDFWIVPMAFQVAPGTTIEVSGVTGTRFPLSQSAVPPERVAEARIISASQDERITDLSVRERSLVLRHRPATAGQRVVAVALVPAVRRVSVAALKRYIALEGAPELAQGYERDNVFPPGDSVTQRSLKFARTVVEVGEGSRAFARLAGHTLELVPASDPSAIHSGQEMAFTVLYRGQPLAGAYLRAGAAQLDTTSAGRPDTTIVTDAAGVARLTVRAAGWWNIRMLHAAPAQGAQDDWEILFATLVFHAKE